MGRFNPGLHHKRILTAVVMMDNVLKEGSANKLNVKLIKNDNSTVENLISFESHICITLVLVPVSHTRYP